MRRDVCISHTGVSVHPGRDGRTQRGGAGGRDRPVLEGQPGALASAASSVAVNSSLRRPHAPRTAATLQRVLFYTPPTLVSLRGLRCHGPVNRPLRNLLPKVKKSTHLSFCPFLSRHILQQTASSRSSVCTAHTSIPVLPAAPLHTLNHHVLWEAGHV